VRTQIQGKSKPQQLAVRAVRSISCRVLIQPWQNRQSFKTPCTKWTCHSVQVLGKYRCKWRMDLF